MWRECSIYRWNERGGDIRNGKKVRDMEGGGGIWRYGGRPVDV